MFRFDYRYVIHDLVIAISTSMYKLYLLNALVFAQRFPEMQAER